MEKSGLMPRMPHDSGWGGSRDYCLPTIPCKVLVCAANKNEKCEIPSLINIRGDGKCQTGVDFSENKIKKESRPFDGD